MAFPSTGGTKEQLAIALGKVRDIAKHLKSFAISVRDSSAAGPIDINLILGLLSHLKSNYDSLQIYKSVSGIGQYAKDQYNDQTFDISAEFTAMETEIQNVIVWLNTNIPTDAQGYILGHKIVANVLEPRTFSTGATSGLRTQLDALIATID